MPELRKYLLQFSIVATDSKRTLRLVIIVVVVALLAAALVYTSFSASSETKNPSSLIAGSGTTSGVQLTGRVVNGSIRRRGESLSFRIRDREGEASVPVRYRGSVPDPFRDGREVIVNGAYRAGVFHADRDSLVTKCPSKFKKKPPGDNA